MRPRAAWFVLPVLLLAAAAWWEPARVVLDSHRTHPISLSGFPDAESGLIYLIHPLRGFYHRRDGKLGTYHVWHDRLDVTAGRLQHAEFALLDRLGLVELAAQQHPHSVLVDPLAQFTIYLPPKRC